MSEDKKCPRCGELMDAPPGTSRRDNETEICGPCCTDEAYSYPMRPVLPSWEAEHPYRGDHEWARVVSLVEEEE